jgi:hypothetical protein
MADGDWSDIPREVIALEFDDEPPVESIIISAWPYVTVVMTLGGVFDIEEISANAYPYVTEVYTMSFDGEFLGTPNYMGEENGFLTIPLEFQPLPPLTSSISGTGIQIIPLGCLEEPSEFWG